jgi:hypothetical protein
MKLLNAKKKRMQTKETGRRFYPGVKSLCGHHIMCENYAFSHVRVISFVPLSPTV